MRALAVAVLPRQAGVGDGRPLAVAAARRAVAVVGVHPGQEVRVRRRATLVEAVVARHGAATAAHLYERLTLRMMARHRDGASLWNDLLLERSGGRG